MYLLATWTVMRWLIAVLTTVAVIALIYHHGLPRTQPWHRVVPGSMLATGLWIASTTVFGWYLRHYADYGVIYGSVGTAIALLIWLFIVSFVILDWSGVQRGALSSISVRHLLQSGAGRSRQGTESTRTMNRNRKSSLPAAEQALNLRRPIYRQTAAYGRFGRDEADFTWRTPTRPPSSAPPASPKPRPASPAHGALHDREQFGTPFGPNC